MQYNITPSAHKSIAGFAFVSFPYKTSGAMYLIVPASVFSPDEPLHLPDIPKSTILILDFAFDSNSTFSSLRSL
jgi:hypothetical protein